MINYDCILMLSGGKDSILVLNDLITKNKKVLTVTYNDGFLSGYARTNLNKTIDYFEVDNFFINYNIKTVVSQFLKSDLVKTVDIYTFVEVFQNILWDKVKCLSKMFGNIPVVTGNIGYFSSEVLLPIQYNDSIKFLKDLGVEIPECECDFISYWAENKFPENLDILEKIGFIGSDGLNTEDDYLKNIRKELNDKYKKITLDDVVEERWEELTAPKYNIGQNTN